MEAEKIFARQGDVVIRKVKAEEAGSITKMMAEAKNTVVAGSHGGAHTVVGDHRLYVSGDVTYVQPKTDTVIEHGDRHRAIPLDAEMLYAMSPQIERRHGQDQNVED